jgi:cell division protein DivIC
MGYNIMRKMSQKTKFRVTFLTIVFIISIVVFVSTTISYVSQIVKNNNEIKNLNNIYNDRLAEEENLKDEINRLQDPEYMAKYAREKYLYSKNGEIIIKIEE